MRKTITALALAATMVLASASVALAAPNDNAACEPVSTATHGEHILAYGPSTGGVAFGTPAHFDPGASPGATFCNTHGNNQAPDLPARP